MTTIKSAFGSELTVKPSATCEGKTGLACEGEYGHLRIYPTAELLAALDAEPKTVAAELRAKLESQETCPCADCDHYRAVNVAIERDALKAKLESQETRLAQSLRNRAEERGTLVKRIIEERHRAESAEAEVSYVRQQLAAAEAKYIAAEAKLGRVAALEWPFVLPTVAGARFEATDNYGKLSTFRAIASGPDIAYLNERTWVTWCEASVRDYCTGHRNIGGGE